MDDGSLAFQVLGPLRAWRDGCEIDLGPPQRRAVLAVLLLRGAGPISRAELLDEVWDEEPPDGADGSLRSHISRLRSALGRDCVVGRAGRYEIVRPRCEDLLEFENALSAAYRFLEVGDQVAAVPSLKDAVRLAAQPALLEIPGPFAARERERIEQRRVDALEQYLLAEVALGREREVVHELAEAASAHPTRQDLVLAAMGALHRSGRIDSALDAYHRTRGVLQQVVGIDPRPDLQEQYRTLLENATLEDAWPDRPPGAAAAAPVAPRAPAGRRTEIAAIVSAPAGSCVAIDGMPGVGKSTLALAVCRSQRATFPDGQVLIDFRAHAAGVPTLTADAAVDMLLRAVNEVPDPSRSFDERAAIWRGIAASRSLIVVLDDVPSPDGISALVPGGSSTCIVTSRAALLSLSADVVVSLEPLDAHASLEVLASILGADRVLAEPESAHQLVARCGGLPLAISIIARRLVYRPSWTLGYLLGRVADESQPLTSIQLQDTSVAAALEMSVDELEHADRTILRLAASLPLPDVTIGGVGALVRIPAGESEVRLERLLDTNLLTQQSPGRYGMHDLVREFAGALPAEPADRERRAALCEHLLRTCAVAIRTAQVSTRPFRLDLPDDEHDDAVADFVDAAAATDWLRAEAAGMLSLGEQCARDGMPGLAWQLVTLPATWLDRLGLHQQLRHSLRVVLGALTPETDPRAECHVRYLLAIFDAVVDGPMTTTRELERLADDIDRLLAHGSTGLGDAGELPWLRSRALMTCAVAHVTGGRYGHAAELLTRVRREDDRDCGSIRVHVDMYLAVIDYYRGDHVACVERLTETSSALQAHEPLHADLQLHLGVANSALGNLDAAAQHLDRALSAALARSDRRLGSQCYAALGVLCTRRGERERAAEMHENSAAQLEGFATGYLHAEHLLASAYSSRCDGRPDVALRQYREALHIIDTTQDRRDRARCLYGTGRCHELMGNSLDAISSLQEAASLFSELVIANPEP